MSRRFLDETGTIFEPVTRYVKAFPSNPDAPYRFANNWQDTDGSTLLHDDCLFVPVRKEQDGDSFAAKPVISTYRLIGGVDLHLNEAVICYLQSTSTGDHTRAARWTPKWLWDFAQLDYAVLKQIGNAQPSKIDEFAGVLELSAKYATGTWENDGIISRIDSTTYYLRQLIRDDKDNEFYHPLMEDPRLDPDELPQEFHGRSVLPL